MPATSENPKESKAGFALADSARQGAKASWLADWLAGQPAGWLAGWLVGWPARWLAG